MTLTTHPEPPPRTRTGFAKRPLRALFLGICLATLPAVANAAICGTYADITRILGDRYKESQRAFGMVNDDGLVEVYTSSGGTWSILMTTTTGRTCVIAAGHTWQEMEKALEGPKV